MARSTSYVSSVNETARIVFLIDDDGDVSVTNDAEAVVAEVNSRYPGYRIVYRDTMFNWDELVHDNGRFTGFAPYRK